MKYVSNAQDLREITEGGLQKAKLMIKGARLSAAIENATSYDHLREVLRYMVVDIYPPMPPDVAYMPKKPYGESY